MNLTRIISIKERIATDPQWKPDERDFILDCINLAIRQAADKKTEEPPRHYGAYDVTGARERS
jgi:hypothetical protein